MKLNLFCINHTYNLDKKYLGKYILNKNKTCRYCVVFKIFLPKDFWSQFYITQFTLNKNYPTKRAADSIRESEKVYYILQY